MPSIFNRILDALLPPSPDVLLARSLTERDFAELFSPREEQGIYALLPYRDPRVRALIRAVKYRGDTKALPLAGRFLGEYLAEIISEKQRFNGWSAPLFVPVPASPGRLRARGYNQAMRIAEAALPFCPGATASPMLGRVERDSQVTVERTRRKDNIKGAFFVPRAEAARGRCIVLIDDVTESGATLLDARRALMEAGAADVLLVALAR